MNPITRTVITAAPRALAWLGSTWTAHPMQVFDQAINLVNQDSDVVSIVTPAVGNGPFSLLVAEGGFRQGVSVHSPVAVGDERLTVGDLSVDVSRCRTWDPRPAWERLSPAQVQTLRQAIDDQLSAANLTANFPSVLDSASGSGERSTPFSSAASQAVGRIQQGFRTGDQQAILGGVVALAGLGVGLTPAGDDFLVGLLYGLWARKGERALTLCQAIAQTASPRTSTLSAAWLAAASQGEAAQSWHDLLDAVQTGSPADREIALRRILQNGETSGADALSGFLLLLNQGKI